MKPPDKLVVARTGKRAAPSKPSTAPASAASKAVSPTKRTDLPGMAPMLSLARQVKDWAESMVAMAGPASDLAVQAVGSRIGDPKARAAVRQGGTMLKRMREAAGLTLRDLAAALNLRDPALLESVEGGSVAIPFEMLLRIASVVGRDDPIAAAMRLTRSSNPDLWKTLEQLGVGRLVLQAGREREFASIYRANNTARQLDDEDFAAVLAFTHKAFDMAVEFRRPAGKRAT
jgi:transcriptional regulator with XRE-family HTH domain